MTPRLPEPFEPQPMTDAEVDAWEDVDYHNRRAIEEREMISEQEAEHDFNRND